MIFFPYFLYVVLMETYSLTYKKDLTNVYLAYAHGAKIIFKGSTDYWRADNGILPACLQNMGGQRRILKYDTKTWRRRNNK